MVTVYKQADQPLSLRTMSDIDVLLLSFSFPLMLTAELMADSCCFY